MALELFPTPSWPRPNFAIPFYLECKKYPQDGEMAARPLLCVAGPENGAPASFWACDRESLYLAVEVPGRAEPGGNEAWRFGDGFLLTVSPKAEDGPVHCYTSLGFGGTSRKPQIVAVNRDGTWFPPLDLAKVKYRFQQDKDKARFSVSVPWSVLEPLRPLLYETISVNLTVLRRSEEGRTIYQLAADEDFDTESTALRRLLPVGFSYGDLNRPLAQSFLTRNCWRGAEPLQLNLGLYNPETCTARLDFIIKDGANILESHSSSVELASGCHHWTLKWSPQGPLPTGKYCLEVGGQGGGRSYKKQHHVYVLNPQEVSGVRTDLLRLEENINCLYPGAVLTALAKLEWLENSLEDCTWKTPNLAGFTEAKTMRDSLRKGLNPLADEAGLSRRAFRSPVDGSLQAYSLYLPRGFSLEQKWPLLVFLHGNGVDELALAANPEAHKLADRLGMVLLFPRARTVGGFYLGPDEKDVMANLAFLKKRLPLDWDRIFIGGFSLGGFGAWHIGLRHPGHFAGIVVISGVPALPLAEIEGSAEHQFNPADFADNAKRLSLLVIHGTKDSAVPVDSVRKVIEALREKGAEPVYKEHLNGGHGDCDWPADLAPWLKAALGRAERTPGI